MSASLNSIIILKNCQINKISFLSLLYEFDDLCDNNNPKKVAEIDKKTIQKNKS